MSGTADPRAGPFSPLVAVAMVLVGVCCFAGFVAVLALGRGPGAADGGAHAESRSAIGFAALAALLRDTGVPVVVSRAARLEESPAGGLLVLTPPPGHAPPDDVTDIAPAGTVLLVLPKWRTDPLDDHPGWVREKGLLPPREILRLLPDAGAPSLRRRGGTAVPVLSGAGSLHLGPGPVDRLQVLDGKGIRPVLWDAANGTVLGQVGDLYVLSDPDLLNNGALKNPEAAAQAVTLLTRLADGGAVVFDLSLNDRARGHDPLRAIMEPPLLGGTLCAAAVAVLIGLLAAVRFGPVRPDRTGLAPGKAALAANSAALLLRARREAGLAAPYAALVRARALRKLGLRPDAADPALDEAVQRRAPGAERWEILRAAAGAVTNRRDLLPMTQRLQAWWKEVDGGHR